MPTDNFFRQLEALLRQAKDDEADSVLDDVPEEASDTLPDLDIGDTTSPLEGTDEDPFKPQLTPSKWKLDRSGDGYIVFVKTDSVSDPEATKGRYQKQLQMDTGQPDESSIDYVNAFVIHNKIDPKALKHLTMRTKFGPKTIDQYDNDVSVIHEWKNGKFILSIKWRPKDQSIKIPPQFEKKIELPDDLKEESEPIPDIPEVTENEEIPSLEEIEGENPEDEGIGDEVEEETPEETPEEAPETKPAAAIFRIKRLSSTLKSSINNIFLKNIGIELERIASSMIFAAEDDEDLDLDLDDLDLGDLDTDSDEDSDNKKKSKENSEEDDVSEDDVSEDREEEDREEEDREEEDREEEKKEGEETSDDEVSEDQEVSEDDEIPDSADVNEIVNNILDKLRENGSSIFEDYIRGEALETGVLFSRDFKDLDKFRADGDTTKLKDKEIAMGERIYSDIDRILKSEAPSDAIKEKLSKLSKKELLDIIAMRLESISAEDTDHSLSEDIKPDDISDMSQDEVEKDTVEEKSKAEALVDMFYQIRGSLTDIQRMKISDIELLEKAREKLDEIRGEEDPLEDDDLDKAKELLSNDLEGRGDLKGSP